jgi:hypothetical protein
MKKNSIVVKNGNKIFKQPALTIGLDLGDRSSCYCILWRPHRAESAKRLAGCRAAGSRWKQERTRRG